jgi:[acyl-carrier-protein] S-malonyltransferase
MRPADQRLAEFLADVPMKRPRIPIVSNVDARPHTDPGEIRDLLMRQILQPVRWEASMRWLLGEGFDCFYELGPARVLKSLLKRIDRKVQCENVPA